LIRYRTIVRDPKDTTILLFSMVMGMSCGLGQVMVALIGTAVVLSVLVLLFLGQRRARAAPTRRPPICSISSTVIKRQKKLRRQSPLEEAGLKLCKVCGGVSTEAIAERPGRPSLLKAGAQGVPCL